MKKLKRNPQKLVDEKAKPIKKKLVLITKKKRCDHINPDGEQCNGMTTGKGNFCNVHSEVIFPETSFHSPVPNSVLSSKYDPIHHPTQFIELSNEGLNPVEIAAVFGVSMATIENWKGSHMLFNQACEIGQAAHEAWYLRQGKDNLDNRFYQTNLFKYLTMNNGMGWSDKAENRSTIQGQFGVLLVPGQMSIDEWEQNNIKKDAELQQRLQEEMIELEQDKETGEFSHE